MKINVVRPADDKNLRVVACGNGASFNPSDCEDKIIDSKDKKK